MLSILIKKSLRIRRSRDVFFLTIIRKFVFFMTLFLCSLLLQFVFSIPRACSLLQTEKSCVLYDYFCKNTCVRYDFSLCSLFCVLCDYFLVFVMIGIPSNSNELRVLHIELLSNLPNRIDELLSNYLPTFSSTLLII